jgi:hypothetical protein
MENSFTHVYIPRIEQRQQNLFKEEYFSGSDTRIYFDGIEQGEITNISYSVNEQLLPIFGYNSRTFDTVAIGNRVINGMFTVAIRNPEAQTPFSEIKTTLSGSYGNSTAFDNQQYNESQRLNMESKDWHNTSKQYDGETHLDGTAVSGTNELLEMLRILGYDYNNYNDMESLIRKFQKDNSSIGLAVTGLFDDATIDAIRKKYGEVKYTNQYNAGSDLKANTHGYKYSNDAGSVEEIYDYTPVFKKPGEISENNLLDKGYSLGNLKYEVEEVITVTGTPYGLGEVWYKIILETGVEGYVFAPMVDYYSGEVKINANVKCYSKFGSTKNKNVIMTTSAETDVNIKWIQYDSKNDCYWYCLRIKDYDNENFGKDLWVKGNEFSLG